MCKSCCNEFVLPKKLLADMTGRCPECGVSVKDHKKDIITLMESGSAFASHSKVEATIYKPAFKS